MNPIWSTLNSPLSEEQHCVVWRSLLAAEAVFAAAASGKARSADGASGSVEEGDSDDFDDEDYGDEDGGALALSSARPSTSPKRPGSRGRRVARAVVFICLPSGRGGRRDMRLM